jgi:hypothetical protein
MPERIEHSFPPFMQALDVTKSLAELSSMDWGVQPPGASLMVQWRYEARRKALQYLTHGELIRFLLFGMDEHILVPVAIARLTANPLAHGNGKERGDGREGELLCATLNCQGFNWKDYPDYIRHLRSMTHTAEQEITQGECHASEYIATTAIYRSLAYFERRHSVIV